jgi:hypothetical protein
VNKIVQDNPKSEWNKVTHHKSKNSNKYKTPSMTNKTTMNRKIKNQKKVSLFPNARKRIKLITFNLNNNNKDGRIKAMSMKTMIKCFLNRMKKFKVNRKKEKILLINNYRLEIIFHYRRDKVKELKRIMKFIL